MCAILKNINGKYIYFFNKIDVAIEEAKKHDNFSIYEYNNESIYIIGDVNANLLKRPHFYDWNGIICHYSKSSENKKCNWTSVFIEKLKELNIKNF